MKIKPASTSNGNSSIDTIEEIGLQERFTKTRRLTEIICEPLEIEDLVVQPVVDVSPPKWHLAHTTWFYEELILKKYHKDYREYHKDYGFLFNSYYETIGKRVMRPNRGNMSRPTVENIIDYRKHVTQNMNEMLEGNLSKEAMDLVILGINHEQQHQELLVTDIKYILGHNPMFPVYRKSPTQEEPGCDADTDWISLEEGIYDVGFDGKGFSFDNENRKHKTYLHDFRIMDRLVTNGEYLEFIESEGYKDFRWWLSEGWDWVKGMEIAAPMYWHKIDGKWMSYKLSGLSVINPLEPVTHISLYEADAYAQWKRLRLPTEFEWEAAATNIANSPDSGTFLDDELFHPAVRKGNSSQFLGDVWEWTNSAYLPYPYFRKAPGAIGEYNGKFMINQKVLRGGSCATPRDHIRLSYRNFFHPQLRWQFNGLRLAETIE